jgi:hypothetical protein
MKSSPLEVSQDRCSVDPERFHQPSQRLIALVRRCQSIHLTWPQAVLVLATALNSDDAALGTTPILARAAQSPGQRPR